MAKIAQGIQHGAERTGAKPFVEALRESLQINIGCIDVTIKLATRRVTHVACGDGHGSYARSTAGVGDIDRVLGEYDRIVISKRHRLATISNGGVRDGLGGGMFSKPIKLAGFGNVPVLAKSTRQIAACRPERQRRGSRQEVVERLFLDRVDAEARGTAVGSQDHAPVVVCANEAQAALAFVKLAEPWTQIALNSALAQLMPKTCPEQTFAHRTKCILADCDGGCALGGSCEAPPECARVFWMSAVRTTDPDCVRNVRRHYCESKR